MPWVTCIECGENKAYISPTIQNRGYKAICKTCRNKPRTLTCSWCGGPFTSVKINEKYCSDKCRKERHRFKSAECMRNLSGRRKNEYAPSVVISNDLRTFNNIEVYGVGLQKLSQERIADTYLGF